MMERSAGVRDDDRIAQHGVREDTELLSMGALADELNKLGAEGAMEVLCRSLTEVVRATGGQSGKASARFGCAAIEVEWSQPVAPRAVSAMPEAAPAATEPELPDGHAVCAPLIGTFYRAPEPGAAPFVEVGDEVEEGQQVGIVEAMKLMNPIVADVAGRVLELLAADAEGVEYGQSLLTLEPRP